MTPEQFQQWRDFALRMARTYPGARLRPSRAWIEKAVTHILDDLAPDCAKIEDWDGTGRTLIVGDAVAEHLEDCLKPVLHNYSRAAPEDWRDRAWDQWMEQWGGPVRCCLRAGLDMVATPSMGVLGFTVGDLRRMYPDGFPAWLDREFQRDGAPVRLAEAPDEAGVWL